MFILFGGEVYYGKGGWADYRGTFETEKEAIEAYGNMAKDIGLEWGHVVDLNLNAVVWREGAAYGADDFWGD